MGAVALAGLHSGPRAEAPGLSVRVSVTSVRRLEGQRLPGPPRQAGAEKLEGVLPCPRVRVTGPGAAPKLPLGPGF